jgi:hypothetical protein
MSRAWGCRHGESASPTLGTSVAVVVLGPTQPEGSLDPVHALA